MELLTTTINEWRLDLSSTIAETDKAKVCHVVDRDGNQAVLKIYKHKSMGLEAEAPEFLKQMDGSLCVKVLRTGPGALLTEYLGGKNLASYVWRSSDEEATDILIDVAETIRARRHFIKPRRSLKDRYRRLLQVDIEQHEFLRTEVFREALIIARFAVGEESSNRGAIHGDLHHGNIFDSSRGWRAIDPIPMFGEPEAEYAQAFCNPQKNIALVTSPARAIKLSEQIERRTGFSKEKTMAWGVAKSAQTLEYVTFQYPEQVERLANCSNRVSALVEAYNSL